MSVQLLAGEIRNRIVEVRKVRFGDIANHPRNPKKHGENQRKAFRGSVAELGFVSVPLAYMSERVGGLCWADGHLRGSEVNGYTGDVAILDIDDAEADKLLLYADPIAAMAEYESQQLDGLLRDISTDDEALQKMLAGLAEEAGLYPDKTPVADPGPQIDKADELRQKWGVESGDLWTLGNHRLICGDCTDKATVERVMDGERAALCHADPPYGMGKEKDGIENDNLYRDKLDTFQMAWWRTARPHLEDNASAYIWGNAEDLWRLWYCGGLRDSERLTLRNEIVWNKEHGQGMESDQHRMYPTVSERCLFFMLGEQGFNNNADNYWEEYEPIRKYLYEQRKIMNWDSHTMKQIAGGQPNGHGDHWTGKSQWSMPTEETYKAWQEAAKGDAFKRDYDDLKRDYDDLKREFYATRAYFDNVHDNMTDVWQFARVKGDDRHGHATPKPVEMIARAIKSSAPDGSIVYVPFGGTLPEVIACEQLSRQCRAVEISPAYVAVALERWSLATNAQPVRVEA